MYELTTDQFGPFERYTLQHTVYPQQIQFIPARGGCLISLRVEDHELLDAYQTPEEVEANSWSKSGLLYPFPNRLRDGAYEWEGKRYQFPLNDGPFNNALHGFGMERPLSVSESHLSENQAVIRMTGQYGGELPYYPWPFQVELSYHLYAPDQFWVEIALENTGQKTIPMGMGWHPYFQLADQASTCDLCLPTIQRVNVDDRLTPTGKREQYDEFTYKRAIDDTILDNCFALEDDHLEVSAKLTGTKGTIRYWQETGPRKFNYLQVFMPPYGTSIALEPMTCNIDAFNNGDGLAHLAPGESLRAKAGVQYFGWEQS